MTFTAPTTYAEAKALMGKDIETPIGTLECGGAGLSGVAGTDTEVFSLSFYKQFGNHMRIVISWDSRDGWVTEDERKAAAWTAKWDKLPTNARKLISLVIGTELEAYELARRADPHKLLRIAKRRLIKAGKLALKTCNRCHGSGHYSYCEMHGTTCFGCGGTGKVLPNTTDALRAARTAQ